MMMAQWRGMGTLLRRPTCHVLRRHRPAHSLTTAAATSPASRSSLLSRLTGWVGSSPTTTNARTRTHCLSRSALPGRQRLLSSERDAPGPKGPVVSALVDDDAASAGGRRSVLKSEDEIMQWFLALSAEAEGEKDGASEAGQVAGKPPGSNAGTYHGRGLVNPVLSKFHCTGDFHQQIATMEVLVENGKLDEAEELLYDPAATHMRTLSRCNQLLFAFAEKGLALRCEMLFNNIMHFRIAPDQFTYASFLYGIRGACTSDDVHAILGHAADGGYTPDGLILSLRSRASRAHAETLAELLTRHGVETSYWQQLAHGGAESDAPSHISATQTIEELYNEQWRREALLMKTVKALPTVSTADAYAEEMRRLDEDDAQGLLGNASQDLSLFHAWLEPLTQRLDEIRAELAAANARREQASQQQQGSTRQAKGKKGSPSADGLKKRPDQGSLLATQLVYNSDISSEDIARLALGQIEQSVLSSPMGAKVANLCRAVGTAVYRLFYLRTHVAEGPSEVQRELYLRYYNMHQRAPANGDSGTHSPFKHWFDLQDEYARETGASVDDFDKRKLTSWTLEMLVSVGGDIVDAVLSDAKLSAITGDASDSDTPAFNHLHVFEGKKRFRSVALHPRALAVIGSGRVTESKFGVSSFSRSMLVSELPMLIPPLPWVGVAEGANLLSPVSFIRALDTNYHHYEIVSRASHMMHDVYDAITHLSNTPWAINPTVFDVAKKIFYTEVGVPELVIPPHNVPDLPPLDKTASESERDQHMEAHKQLEKEKAEMFSLRTFLHLRLMVAEMFKDAPFYLPHNLDFRGRAYTMSPYLTYIGDDLCRGLLLFGKKKPLGSDGLRWLKIHVSNVYGNDKCSLDERAQFADDHIDDIVEAASQPLKFLETGESMWWLQSENPWQTLAACVELTAALNSPNPSLFESALPVHQDGTCNGLQHYAALGRDVDGARHVNLAASLDVDRPGDVYSAVARTIDVHLQQHALGNLEGMRTQTEAQKKDFQKLAQLITSQGPLKRKIVKQTIMTNVYGVTFVGGRDQILRQLKSSNLVPESQARAAAGYLTQLVFLSLSEIFERAQVIQKWLSRQAKHIASSGEPVSWITPLGLPVVQPYHEAVASNFYSKLQVIHLIDTANPQQLPAVSKQSSAFPPNFIHSLDATHMMMTALRCSADDITFASVHDSYWTHASTVADMSRYIREEFVSMHKKPILESLHSFFTLAYEGRPYSKAPEKTCLIEACPGQGDFDIDEVLSAKYFFS